MNARFSFALSMFMAAASACGESVSLTADPIAIDTTSGRIVIGSCGVAYGTDLVGGAEDATVSLYRIYNAGTEQVVSSKVETAGSDGVATLTPEAGRPSAFRLAMCSEKDGALLGELTCDLAFGIATAAEPVRADTTTNSLQVAIQESEILPLTYDAAWADGAVSSLMQVVTRTRPKRGPVTISTNDITTVSGAGVYQWNGAKEDGYRTLLLTLLDASGVTVGETIATSEFEVRVPPGLCIILR